MGQATPRFTDAAAQPLLRILIASYFIAVALGAIPGTDLSVLTALVLPAPFDRILAMAAVLFLGWLVLAGHWLRGAALTLGLLTFWASYITMLELGVAEELGGFWRDIALVAALVLTYGGPAAGCPSCPLSRPAMRPDLFGRIRAALPQAAPAAPPRPREVSIEERLSLFRADFEQVRPD